MARWRDNRLNLGALGKMLIAVDEVLPDSGFYWRWVVPTDYGAVISKMYPTSSRAKRAAESWLRRALKQASKRLEG